MQYTTSLTKKSLLSEIKLLLSDDFDRCFDLKGSGWSKEKSRFRNSGLSNCYLGTREGRISDIQWILTVGYFNTTSKHQSIGQGTTKITTSKYSGMRIRFWQLKALVAGPLRKYFFLRLP